MMLSTRYNTTKYKSQIFFLYLFGDFDRLIGDEASQLLNISEVMEPRFARLIVNDPVRCWSRARITRSTRSCGAFSHSHRSTSSASKSMTRPITPQDLCSSTSSNPYRTNKTHTTVEIHHRTKQFLVKKKIVFNPTHERW